MLKAADQIKHDRTWCVPINIETTFVTKTIFLLNLNFLIPQMQNHQHNYPSFLGNSKMLSALSASSKLYQRITIVQS